MPIYKGTTELTKIADFLTATEHDITEVYFGDKQVFTVWGEYDGTLPAQFNANGDDLKAYKIWGNTGGVGKETVNLYDKNTTINGYFYNSGGTLYPNERWKITGEIQIEGGKTYVAYGIGVGTSPTYCCVWDANHNLLTAVVNANPTVINTPSNAAYIGLSLRDVDSEWETAMLVEGTTAPAEYVPYGYELDMSVSDGTTSTITPIYIGDTPLGEDEYVDYKEQKVHKRTVQIMPSAPAETKILNGVTVTCDGEGRYNISGTATSETQIKFNLDEFTVPVSVGQGGHGTLSFFNDFADPIVSLSFYYDNTLVDTWEMYDLIMTSTTYSTLGEKKVNAVSIYIPSNTTLNNVISPMFTDNGTLPETYIPYLQPTDPPVPLPALPTVDGVNVVDYAGQSVAVPERFIAKYRKEKF